MGAPALALPVELPTQPFTPEFLLGHLDSVLRSFELMVQSPQEGNFELTTSHECDSLLEEIETQVLSRFREMAAPEFKAGIRRLAPERADRFDALVDAVVAHVETSLTDLRRWRDFVADVEKRAPGMGLTPADVINNDLARWFFGLPEEEQRAWDDLAEAGRVFKGDRHAERQALKEGRHPLQLRGRAA